MRHIMQVATALALISAASRQSGAQVAKLDGRFPPTTDSVLRVLIDSARASGLPTEPLIQRALEGGSRGVENERVVSSVRGLLARLGTAREALGASASEAELVAGASALYLGVGRDTLSLLRKHRATGSLALPLVVLADLIHQGVPHDSATAIMLSLGDAGIPDEGYRALRQAVLLDIRSGIPPAAAASMRAQGALLGRSRNVPRPKPAPSPPR